MGGFSTLNNAWMNLWSFYVTPFLSISVSALSGQPVSSASVFLVWHQPVQSGAFAPFPVTTLSCVETKPDSASLFFFFFKATACQRVITTRRIRLLRSVKRQCDVCWHVLAQYSIFTSSVTITAWARGYCHAVAMTSGIHKKILVCLVQRGRPVDKNTHTHIHT